ncbi:hypothetical protein E2320_001689 [Naja naja]|nr:hypothetical protein E2320_001689 [Naja naja]
MMAQNFLPFWPTTETWTSYINRFECVMDAANLSDIPSNRKKKAAPARWRLTRDHLYPSSPGRH